MQSNPKLPVLAATVLVTALISALAQPAPARGPHKTGAVTPPPSAVLAASPHTDPHHPRLGTITTVPERTTEPLCVGTGADGPRIHVVVAVPDGVEPPSSPALRRVLLGVDDLLADTAWVQQGEVLRVRYATDNGEAGCSVTMRTLALPAGASAGSLGAVSTAVDADAELSALRYSDDARLLVFHAGTSALYCGMAFLANPVDAPWAWVAQVNCPDPATVAHELFHMLGAVDSHALHATAGGHCDLSADVMCYADSDDVVMKPSACPGQASPHVDCTGELYLNLHGGVGGDDTVRNIATSKFFEHAAESPVAPPVATSSFKAASTQRPRSRDRYIAVTVTTDPTVSSRVEVRTSTGCRWTTPLNAGHRGTLRLRARCLTTRAKSAVVTFRSSIDETRRVTVRLRWRS